MRRLLGYSIASLLLAAPASGAVLHSAPASSGYSGDYLICWVRNVSATPRKVTVAFLDFAGNAVGGGGLAYTVPPGESQTVAANPIPEAASCRFEVAGSAKSVRASAVYYDPDTSQNRIVIPAE